MFNVSISYNSHFKTWLYPENNIILHQTAGMENSNTESSTKVPTELDDCSQKDDNLFNILFPEGVPDKVFSMSKTDSDSTTMSMIPSLVQQDTERQIMARFLDDLQLPQGQNFLFYSRDESVNPHSQHMEGTRSTRHSQPTDEGRISTIMSELNELITDQPPLAENNYLSFKSSEVMEQAVHQRRFNKMITEFPSGSAPVKLETPESVMALPIPEPLRKLNAFLSPSSLHDNSSTSFTHCVEENQAVSGQNLSATSPTVPPFQPGAPLRQLLLSNSLSSNAGLSPNASESGGSTQSSGELCAFSVLSSNGLEAPMNSLRLGEKVQNFSHSSPFSNEIANRQGATRFSDSGEKKSRKSQGYFSSPRSKLSKSERASSATLLGECGPVYDPKTGLYEDSTMISFLRFVNLEQYTKLLTDAWVDMGELFQMSVEELHALGIPLADCEKIRLAISGLGGGLG